MKHSDFTQGFKEQTEKARKFFNGRWATITGPDGLSRRGQVQGTIITEQTSKEWVVCCYFHMERLDGSPDRLEADWARTYFEIDHRYISWDDPTGEDE